jgi:hypothetical protein
METQKAKELLIEEMALCQERIARAMKTENKTRHYIDKLELSMEKAKRQWKDSDEITEYTWLDINNRLKRII